MIVQIDYKEIRKTNLQLIEERSSEPLTFIAYKNEWQNPDGKFSKNISAIISMFYASGIDPVSAAELLAELVDDLSSKIQYDIEQGYFGVENLLDFKNEKDTEIKGLLVQRLKNVILGSICKQILLDIPTDQNNLLKVLNLINGMIDRGVLTPAFLISHNLTLTNFIANQVFTPAAQALQQEIVKKLSDPYIILGMAMIDKVKHDLVFGSGNDPEAAAHTGGWSKTIEYSGRTPHTFTNDQPMTWQFSQAGEPLKWWGIEDDPRYLGTAFAARIGNCKENGLLALYHSLLLQDENNAPVFSKLSMVRFIGVDHTFVRAEHAGGVIFIDPWKNECYREQDFAYFNNGKTAKQLKVELQVFTDANKVDSKKYSISSESFLEAAEKYRKLYLLGLYVNPAQMDAFYGKYNHLAPEQLSFTKFLQDGDFVDQRQRLNKAEVIAEMKRVFEQTPADKASNKM